MNYPHFDPTPIIAGDFPLKHRPVTVAGGQNAAGTPLPRGTVLGQRRTDGAVASIKASGANTGNGTIALDGATPTLAYAMPGIYTVRFTAATTFQVSDPRGDLIGVGATGAVFADQVKFSTTAGSAAFVAGDGFDITVSGTGKFVISKAGATDGSQVPLGVTADDVDTAAGDVLAPLYETGEFAFEVLTVDPSWTIAALNAALPKGQPLFFRSVGAAP